MLMNFLITCMEFLRILTFGLRLGDTVLQFDAAYLGDSLENPVEILFERFVFPWNPLKKANIKSCYYYRQG